MGKLGRKSRLILGLLGVLLSVVLSWGLREWLDGFSLLAVLPGAWLFIWLNPELMGGD
ncbi:MAG: hypothetical protein RSB55_08620 [Oscillospiraceae bacterium]